MRAKLRRVETNAGHPLLNEPRVLARRQSARIATAGEQELARLARRQAQVLINRLASLVSQLEPNWPTRLLLADGCAIHGVTVRGYIIDANGDDVAAAQLAIDRQVEEGKVAILAFDLELRSDRPHVAGSQWRLRTDKLPFVPRHARSGMFLFHGLSPF